MFYLFEFINKAPQRKEKNEFKVQECNKNSPHAHNRYFRSVIRLCKHSLKTVQALSKNLKVQGHNKG